MHHCARILALTMAFTMLLAATPTRASVSGGCSLSGGCANSGRVYCTASPANGETGTCAKGATGRYSLCSVGSAGKTRVIHFLCCGTKGEALHIIGDQNEADSRCHSAPH